MALVKCFACLQGAHRLDRPPVCQQLVLLVRQGALHLQLDRRVHQQAQLALLLQQEAHQVNLVHREERRVGLLVGCREVLCQVVAHPEPPGCPEVEDCLFDY